MKVHITACETHPDAWRHQEQRLRELWNQSRGPHVLVTEPEAADFIVITDVRDENWLQSLRDHPLPRRFPHKCFAVSDQDDPLPLLRGVYTSAHRGLLLRSRYRSGCYSLYHSDFRNPFVETYQGLAFERPKKWLLSFSGRDCHPVRNALFAAFSGRADCFVRDTSHFNVFSHDQGGKAENQRAFVEVLEASKFALCPRGHGASSIRLFEAMRLGVAPIIVSDAWIPPKGPAWGDFALFVRERDVHRVEEIALQHEPHYRAMGRAAAEAYYRFFADDAYFNFFVEQLADIQRAQLIPERWVWASRNSVVFYLKLKDRVRFIARKWSQRIRRSTTGAPPAAALAPTTKGSPAAAQHQPETTVANASETKAPEITTRLP